MVSLQVDLDFDPRGRNNREIGSERIYAKVISAMKVDVLDRVSKTLDPRGSRFAVRKREVPVDATDNQDLTSEAAREAGAAPVGGLVSGSARNLLTISGTSAEAMKL